MSLIAKVFLSHWDNQGQTPELDGLWVSPLHRTDLRLVNTSMDTSLFKAGIYLFCLVSAQALAVVKYLGITVALIKMKYVANNKCLTSTSGKERVTDTGYILPPETAKTLDKIYETWFSDIGSQAMQGNDS